jgi:predicted transcriptional regulator
MKYRSRTDIVYQIVQIAGRKYNGAKKTEIIYGAFLSSKQFRDYITLLIDHGLLQYRPEIRTFNVTEKGRRFLELYDSIGIILQEQQV